MNSRLVRGGGASLIGSFSSAVIGVVGIRVLTEMAPPEVFGEASLLLSVLTLVMAAFVNPFTNTQLRFHSGADDADAFTRAALVWSVVAAVATGVALVLAYPLWLWSGGHALGAQILAAGFVWLIASAARQALLSRLQAESRLAAFAALSVLEATLLVGVSATLLAFNPVTEAYLWGQALAVVAMIFVGYSVAPLARKTPAAPGSPERLFPMDFARLAVRYGAPFLPLAVLGWVANLSDRYVLAESLGPAAAGHYLAAAAIASRGMMLANGAVTDVMRPRLFNAVNRAESAEAGRVLRQWLALRFVVGGAALMGLAAFGWLIARLLLAQEYRADAEAIMLWVGAAFAIFGLSQVLETRLFSLDRTVFLIPAVAIGAAANLGFSLLLIPSGGPVAAGQALCAGYSVQLVCVAIMLAAALRLDQRRSTKSPPESAPEAS